MSTTTRTRRLAAGAAVALATLVAGCSVSTNDEPIAVSDQFARVVQSTTTSSTAPPSEGGTRTVQVYFVESKEGATTLVPVPREVEAEAGVEQVIGTLFADQPTERRLRNDVPPSAVLLGAGLLPDMPRVVVNTQGLFGQSGVQNPQLRNALGQIVCTATELQSVDSVLFQNEGRPVDASIENSGTVGRAVDCSDYDQLS